MRIDINIAAMALLGAVFLIAFRGLERGDKLNSKFLYTSLIIIVELFLETTSCLINRHSQQWLIPLSVFLHACLYITAPILTYFWFVFIHSWIIPEGTISRRKNILLLIPIGINIILTALSPIYGLVFSVNSNNVYQRGPLFVLSASTAYFYLLYSLLLIIKQKQKIIKHEFVPLFLAGILPPLGGLIQTLFYGTLLMWSSAAFSLVIVYIYLQKRMIHLDNLTGAWTRGSFDYYISQRVKHKNNDEFGIIYIDMDGLKQINDMYGHFEGDYAIKTAVQLIKEPLRKTDIVARIGGDEFVVILDCKSKESLDKTIERINMCFIKYNEKSEKSYKLGCSMGADIFSMDYKSIEQFLHHVDSLMYENKKRKRSN